MKKYNNKHRINDYIMAKEVRLINENNENVGIVETSKALQMAEDLGLDLIEITSNTKPPVAKIADYGKFQYAEKKKIKEAKHRSIAPELKVVQIKIGTGDHDLELKAKRITEWLEAGSRIKIDLFLPGRSKYLNRDFLNARFERVLKFVSLPYKIIQSPLKSPKGLTMIIDKE